MSLLSNLPLPSFSSSKEIRGVQSRMLRWIWAFYTSRLTQAGRWFLWPTIGFLALASASLYYEAFLPLSYVFAIWLIAFLASLFLRPRVALRVRHAARICAGETLTVEAEVEHLGSSGSDLYVIPHRLPAEIDAQPSEGVALPQMEKGQTARVKLGLLCRKRGVYTLQGYRVETDFPFGVITAARRFEVPETLLVYPGFNPLTKLELPTGRRFQPGGVALASEMGDSAEYQGNREYREGDNVRDIDWRATARFGSPIVREYRQEYFLRVAVVVDTHVPANLDGAVGVARRRALEDGISIAAAVGDYLSRKEYIVDMFAAGPNLYHLTAGRSLAYLDQILDILACLGESPTEPFDAIAPELMANLATISSIVCVFLEWSESRRLFVQSLRDQGVGVKVIVIDGAAGTGGEDMVTLSPKDILSGVEEL